MCHMWFIQNLCLPSALDTPTNEVSRQCMLQVFRYMQWVPVLAKQIMPQLYQSMPVMHRVYQLLLLTYPQVHQDPPHQKTLIRAYGTRPLSRCYHDKMTLESLLNQFKSENIFLGRGTYYDKELHLSRTRESLCGFGHVQNFYQIGKICNPAVKQWGALLL